MCLFVIKQAASMCSSCIVSFVVCVPVLCTLILNVGGDPVLYLPPFEVRSVSADKVPYVPMENSHMVSSLPQQLMPQASQMHPLFHRAPEDITATSPRSIQDQVTAAPNTPTVHPTNDKNENSSVSVHDLLTALGIHDPEQNKTSEHERAAQGRDYESPYPSYGPYPRPPQDYSQYPSHGYWPPPSYYERPYAYLPPMYAHHTPVTSKPTALFSSYSEKPAETHVTEKPAESKVATKISGLIELVIALLTGSTKSFGELKGIKDVIINGVVKPLLMAKSGIKTLIGKLAIPVIVLLLINLEVLVLIWWLWEDCSSHAQAHATSPSSSYYPYPYPKPASSYGYSSNYR